LVVATRVAAWMDTGKRREELTAVLKAFEALD
jgi:hypothetical protein